MQLLFLLLLYHTLYTKKDNLINIWNSPSLQKHKRTLNRLKFDPSSDLIMVDWTNAIRLIICSIEYSIVSSLINPSILSLSIELIHYDQSNV